MTGEKDGHLRPFVGLAIDLETRRPKINRVSARISHELGNSLRLTFTGQSQNGPLLRERRLLRHDTHRPFGFGQLLIGNARDDLFQWRGHIRECSQNSFARIRDIAVKHRRQLPPRQSAKRHQVWIKLHPQWLIGQDKFSDTRRRKTDLD